MHPRIRGQRNDAAHRRIVEAAEALAERFDLGDHAAMIQSVKGRDQHVLAMRQREVVADLLDALVAATDPEPVEEGDSGEPEAPPAPPAPVPGPIIANDDLPDDFPGRKRLVAAGFTSLAAVRGLTMNELIRLPGIGKGTAEEIIAAASSVSSLQE